MRAWLAATALCLGCAAARPIPTQAERDVDAIVQPYIDGGWARTIAVGLLRDGKREVRRFGTPGAADDVFAIGSVTKVFTALLLADAVTRGQLALDDDVSRCLPPEVKPPGRMSFAQLATHTSGLPRLGDMPMKDPRDPYADFDEPQLYKAVSAATLGPQQYAYSNLGVALLGEALSRCAKKPYGALVQSVIAAPLGLKETGLDVPLTVQGHDFNGEPAPPWKMPLPGAGGLRSSAEDLLTLLAAEIDPPPALREAIELSQRERAKRPGGAIALGWHIGGTGMPDIYWHNGMTGSFHAFVAFDRARKLGVVLLADTALPTFDEPAATLMHLLRGEPHAPPLQRIVVPAAKLQTLAGHYSLGMAELTVTVKQDRLWVQLTGQDAYRVWAVAPNVFVLPLVDARLRFAPDGSEVTLTQNGVTTKAPRMKP